MDRVWKKCVKYRHDPMGQYTLKPVCQKKKFGLYEEENFSKFQGNGGVDWRVGFKIKIK